MDCDKRRWNISVQVEEAAMPEEGITTLTLRPGADFVETPYVQHVTKRALVYIQAGFPVHLSGPAGVGKTTLAFHIAAHLDQPAVLMCGDHDWSSSDLRGGPRGYRRHSLRDNFIRSVVKTDETVNPYWVDGRLAVACERGFTLVYDEFTRSRPETNNVLLSILQEKILPLNPARGDGDQLEVSPAFRAIFTSNPGEYAGVYRGQDALLDRMVTIELGNFDEETEIAITRARSGLAPEQCAKVVRLVRQVREAKANKMTPTVRACIAIARILNLSRDGNGGVDDSVLRDAWRDVVMPHVPSEERGKVDIIVGQALTSELGRR